MASITYGTCIIEFEVLRKVRMKHTYIEVTKDGVLVKTNKSTSIREIKSFVMKKSAWILKHLKRLEAKKVEQIYYLGKRYDLQIDKEKELKHTTLEFTGAKFIIGTQVNVTKEEIAWSIDMFYKQNAIDKITPLVDKWSKEMGLRPTYLGFRKAKTRWGSCSSRDRISLNYYLMKMPISVIEYVVVHELAHIEQKNHSADFWGLVGKYLVDYKSTKEKLREFERIM